MTTLLAILKVLPKLLDFIKFVVQKLQKTNAARLEDEKAKRDDALIDDLAAGRVPVDPAKPATGQQQGATERSTSSRDGSAAS